MEVPRLRDYFTLTSQQESITQEMHYIPGSSPYAVDLHQLPKIRTGATTIAANVWLSVADASTLFTIEIETSPSTWQACTLTTSAPGTLEAQFQIATTATFPYSPRIIFNATYAGKQVRITYTGMGSEPLAGYLQWLFDFASRQQLAGPIQLIDQETNNSGWYDGRGTADQTVYATPSNMAYVSDTLDVLTFDGLTLDFGLTGNCEVAGFTNANYWKRILIELDHNGSAWTVSTSESSESSAQGSLTTPDVDFTKIVVGYIDVQNTGVTATAGEVEDIASGNVQQMAQNDRPSLCEHTVRVSGALTSGNDIVVPFAPHNAIRIYGVGMFVDDSGSAGSTTIDIHKGNAGDSAGATIFSSAPTVAAAAGADGKDYATGADFSTTAVTSADWLRFHLDSVATDAEDLTITVYYHIERDL